MEKGRKSIAFAVFGRSSHRFVGHVFFFITWFGTLPTNHRVALRRKESGSRRREIKAGRFLFHYQASSLAILRHLVAERNVVVAQLKDDVDFLLVGILKSHGQFVSRIVYRGTFDTSLRVSLVYLVGLLTYKRHLLTEIADVGHKSQGRIFQDGLAVVSHRINRFAALQLKIKFQAGIRSSHCRLLGKCLSSKQCQCVKESLFFHKCFSR